MKTFSFYRGQSRSGIGEGPGNPPVPHGEQYLAAEGVLAADGELLKAARPWMTPDWRVTDEQELGEEIEAWSCFRHGPLRIVARLVAAGIYDRRTAYFAHGRAFLADEIAGACDPGACLGHPAAFDRPWRDGQRPPSKALPQPEPVRPEQILQEPGVAGALLAHLYQGLVSGYPVVMAVPAAEFRAGSPLPALVSFARAALPRDLKSQCQIRVFTRLPELFLRHLRADLVVIPEKEAADALAARRDATLLDRKGLRREGREIAPEAAAYAEAVLRRFLAFKGEGLLAFSGAIGSYLPAVRLPNDQEIGRIPAVYNFLIARTDPARLGEWLKSSLLKQVHDRPTGLPWEHLIRPEDWRALSFADLADVLLTGAAGGESALLVQCAEAEARRPERREQISEERLTSRLCDLPAERRPVVLARLLGGPGLGRPLVASAVAARLSASLSISELLAAGAAAPLLAAELDAGLLGQRARDVSGLARAAAREPEVAGILAQATSAGELSADWAQRLLAEAPEPALLQAVARILPVAMASPPWQATLGSLLDRILTLPSFPASLQPHLAKALERTRSADPAAALHDRLALTELLVRSEAPEARTAVEEAWRAAEALSDAGDRRDFIDKVIDSTWQSLQPDRLVSCEGRFSPAWAKSFQDRLLQSPEVRDQLSTAALLALAGERPEIGPWLDPRMARDPRSTTAGLLKAGRWPLWRDGSRQEKAGSHEAALAWLTSETWSGKTAPQAHLEDWKRVMSDLGGLSAGELRDLFNPRPLWPWIIPFQDEQLADLSRAAQSDLGVLAELAESLDPERDLKYSLDGTIFEHVLALAGPAGQGLPGNALAHLAGSRIPDRPLSPQQAAVLHDRTHHRGERAAAAVSRSVQASLEGDPLAALQAADRLPSWDRELLGAVQRWADGHPQKAQRGEIGEILRRRSRPAGRNAPTAGAHRPQLHPVIQALLHGDGGNGCWQKLTDAITSYVGTATGPHPVAGIAAGLREACPHLNGDEREMLESRGWSTLAAVTQKRCTILRQPLQKGAPLPAFELASLLLPRLGPGRVALCLLDLEAAGPYLSQPEWWDSLLAAVAGCRRNGGARQPGDREEAALGRIYQAVPDLFASHQAARPALIALEDRMEWFYLQQGLPLSRNLEPRLRAGAAS